MVINDNENKQTIFLINCVCVMAVFDKVMYTVCTHERCEDILCFGACNMGSSEFTSHILPF